MSKQTLEFETGPSSKHFYEIEIAVRKRIESLNKWQRMHWALRSKAKKEWWQEIIAACNGRVPRKRVKKKKKVVIVSYRKRKLDYDNLVGGGKPMLDALRKLKFIWDDSPEWLEIDYIQKLQTVGELTIIKVRDI